MKILKTPKIVKLVLHSLGFILSTVPPVVCTASYFPLWKESSQTLSGGVLLIILLSAIPLYKFLKKVFESPASYMIWLVLFLLFFSLSKIADEMTVISFVGFMGNALGAVCFNIAKRIGAGRDE